MNRTTLTLGSLFDGIGGWQLAAVHAGITPVWSSEIEPFPIEVTKRHFPDTIQLGDVTKLNGARIPPVDIICAGSPCQDLSVAGKRAGLAGERSGLFVRAVDIVRQMRRATGGKQPRFFVWENVPGAFSSNHRRDFQAVLETIGEAEIPMPPSGRWADAGLVRTDAADIAWRVLDAQYWGVPQRRKRIFLVADFATEGRRAGEILFEPARVQGDTAEGTRERERAAAGTESGAHESSLTPWDVQSNRISDASGTASAVYAGEGQGTHGGAVFVGVAENSRGELRTTGDVHPCLATGGGKPGEGYPCIMSAGFTRKNSAKARSIGYHEEQAPTIATDDKATVFVSGGYAAFDEKQVAGSVRASGGDRGGGQREPRETVGTLAARDFKGVGNQYVQEGKLVVQDD